MENGEKLATLGQESLTIRMSSKTDDAAIVVVSARATAKVVVPDLQANDAVVHIVDTVLVPDSVRIDQ